MPLYEYQCEACGHRFEKIQKFSDPLVEECPNCGQKQVHKLVSSPAIQFKGTGWYITDYAKKSGVGADSSSKSSEAKDGDSKGSVSAGSESKTGDAKGAETKSSDAKTPDSKSSDTKPATTTQS
jgi:putative FmdB family regulatory protein